MINFLANPASLLGIGLIACGVALYFMRTMRPELSRDHDIFFSAVALITGFILLFQGWLLEPLLLLGQFSLAGTAIFFAVENIRMRGITTEQAKRLGDNPVVDEERPVSRVYRAELDDDAPYLDYADDRPSRRIRGTRDGRPAPDYYDDDRERAAVRRPSADRRLRGSDRSSDRPPVRRRPSASRPAPRLDASRVRPDWEAEPVVERPVERPSSDRPSRPPLPPEEEVSASGGSSYRMRSPRASSDAPRRRPSDADYADYRPIDYPAEPM